MTLGRNVLWGFGESFVRLIITFFVNVLIARHLGPENYGILTAAFVVVNWASAFGGLGLDTVVIRELANSKNTGALLGSAFRLRLLAASLSLVVLMGLSIYHSESIFSLKDSMWGAVLIMMLLIPFQSLAFGYGNAFTANLRADLLTIGKTTGLVIATIARIVGLVSGFSFLYFASCHVVEHLISTIIVRSRYQKHLKEKIGSWFFEREAKNLLIEGGKWLFLSAIIISIIQGAGVLLLKSLSSEIETGIYSGALRLALVLQFAPAIICKTFLPIIVSRQKAGYKNECQILERELFKLLWLFGYSVSVFFLLFGDLLVPFILGEEYRASAKPLKVLAVMLIPLSVGAARTVYFAKDRAYKKILTADVTGALLTVVLGFYLIPIYGAVGAAVASLIAATIGYLVVPYVFLERGKASSAVVFKAAFFPFPNFKLLLGAKKS